MDKNLRSNTLLGIGQPILDIIVKVDENFLKEYDLKENSAIIANKKHDSLFNEINRNYKPNYIAGGCVHNTLSIIQWLIKKPKVTTFIGSIGEDENSRILLNAAKEIGIKTDFEKISWKPTSICAVLITNTNRTLCTKIGAANLFSVEHLESRWHLIENAEFYYIMAFFLVVNSESVLKIAEHSYQNGKKFIMNMSAEFIFKNSKYNYEFMKIFPYVDIMFGNESEFLALAETLNISTSESIPGIIVAISNLPKKNPKISRICIMTRGKDSVLVAAGGEISEFPVIAIPDEKIVDTNGAGDAFVGGFLTEFIRKKSLNECIQCGLWCAHEIIQRQGCTLDL